MLVCAVTCSVLPASESFAARNNNNWSNPSVATGGAVRPVSSGAVSGKRPETVSHGAIWNNPDIQGDWDFSDIFSWIDGINWDDLNWQDVNWSDINWDDANWNDIDWGNMFPVTGGAIGGGFPQQEWPNIDWPDFHQRPVVTGGAIGGEQPENTDKHQKPVTSGGAIGADKPNRGDGENQKPSDETQKPATPDNGKENEAQKPTTPDNGKENETQKPDTPDNGKENEAQKPTTPDNGKENNNGQNQEKDATDSHKQPVATVTDGAVNAQVPDENKEQKLEEDRVPAATVSNSAVTATKKKKAKAKIKVSTASKKVKKGKKYKIKYSVVSGSGKVTFKSSNKKVATVTSKGVVKAKRKGTAIITVKIAKGNTKKVKITVK